MTQTEENIKDQVAALGEAVALLPDEAVKNNKIYDSLNEMATNVFRLFEPIQMLAQLVKRDEVVVRVTNKDLYRRLSQQLKEDGQRFLDTYNELRSLHQGKTGDARTAEEFRDGFKIYEAYIAYNTEFNQVIIPTYNQLLNLMHVAETTLKEDLQKVQAAAIAGAPQAQQTVH